MRHMSRLLRSNVALRKLRPPPVALEEPKAPLRFNELKRKLDVRESEKRLLGRPLEPPPRDAIRLELRLARARNTIEDALQDELDRLLIFEHFGAANARRTNVSAAGLSLSEHFQSVRIMSASVSPDLRNVFVEYVGIPRALSGTPPPKSAEDALHAALSNIVKGKLRGRITRKLKMRNAPSFVMKKA